MFLLVLVGILLLALFWRYILVVLCLLVLVHIMRAIFNTAMASQPNYRSKPAPVPARTAAKPARELPASGYLPRWDAARRMDAGRELAQWQKQFDSEA